MSHVGNQKVAGAYCNLPLFLPNAPVLKHLHKMASVLKAQEVNAAKADAKGKGKRKADDMDIDEETAVHLPKRTRNKQRVLLLSSRGVTHRMRHLMNDIEVLLPHVKKGTSMCTITVAEITHTLFIRRQIGFQKSPSSLTGARRPEQL